MAFNLATDYKTRFSQRKYKHVNLLFVNALNVYLQRLYCLFLFYVFYANSKYNFVGQFVHYHEHNNLIKDRSPIKKSLCMLFRDCYFTFFRYFFLIKPSTNSAKKFYHKRYY